MRCEITEASIFVHRHDGNGGLRVIHKREPVPDKPESEWKDGDEITRAQAIQRLGMTPSYFRDLLAAEKIRVHRVSAKMHKYIWDEVREDWIKVRDSKV